MELLKMFGEIKTLNSEIVSSGFDDDISLLLDYMEIARQNRHSLENENIGLRSMVQTYNVGQETSRQEVKQIKAQLVEARSQIAALMSAKQEVESEKGQLEQQIDVVREIIQDDFNFIPEPNRKRLEFLKYCRPSVKSKIRPSSMSLLSENEIDYDKTDEDLDFDVSHLRNGKTYRNSSREYRKRSRSAPRAKPSAPPIPEDAEPTPKKRSIGGQRPQTPTIATIPVPTLASEPRRPSLNKSISEPHLLSPHNNRNLRAIPPYMTGSTMVINGMSPALNINTPTGSLSTRRHTFFTKTILKPEACDACTKRIQFGKTILRCQDCKTQCHPECREIIMIPCIPRGTPSKNQKCKIVDFVPQVPPMIPHVLIHCINEIERRGLDSIGLYRIPGTETKVNELLNNFLWGKGVPNLRLIDDVNTIAGCIKRFLQQLKEPIIPTTSWLDFVRAASVTDEHGRYDNQALHRAIAELPMPNKDTLSFLILHFQRIASMKESNKMCAENLAKVFGPSIVGYSCEQVDLTRGLEEASKQEMVILSLLSLPADYWNRLVNWGDTMPLVIEPSLFETRPAPNNATATLPGGTPCGNFSRSNRGNTLKTPKSSSRFFQPPWK